MLRRMQDLSARCLEGIFTRKAEGLTFIELAGADRNEVEFFGSNSAVRIFDFQGPPGTPELRRVMLTTVVESRSRCIRPCSLA